MNIYMLDENPLQKRILIKVNHSERRRAVNQFKLKREITRVMTYSSLKVINSRKLDPIFRETLAMSSV